MDLRKPGEEEDEYSEMAEEAMDPENCFPDGEHTVFSAQRGAETMRRLSVKAAEKCPNEGDDVPNPAGI